MTPPSQLRVAVLDDYNNLAAEQLSGLPTNLNVTCFSDTILPQTDATALIARLHPFEIICTMRERTPLPRHVINKLPNLKVIFTTGMRNLSIDMEACLERGIPVYGTPNPPPPEGVPDQFNATVQHTWALILALVNNVPRDQAEILEGRWLNATPLNTFIGGLTLGVLGLGKLGTGVARIAKLAFGMRVIAWSENLTQVKADEAACSAGLSPGDIRVVAKTQLFELSDILSVHYVLSDRSRAIVGRQDLARMKPTSFLINTSRGPLIDESSLLDLLSRGAIRGAAIDVFDIEPLPIKSPWRTTQWGHHGSSQVVLTPHTGYSFEHSIGSMWASTRSSLQRLAAGEDCSWRLV